MSTWKEAGRRSVPKVHWSSDCTGCPGRTRVTHPGRGGLHSSTLFRAHFAVHGIVLGRGSGRHTHHTHAWNSRMALPYRVTGDVATSLCPSLVPPPPMPLMSPASFADEVQIEEECLLRLLVAHYHGHLHAADCVPHGCGYLTVRGRGDAHQSRGGACVCVCACTLRDQSRVLEGMSAGEGGLRRAESSSQAVADSICMRPKWSTYSSAMCPPWLHPRAITSGQHTVPGSPTGQCTVGDGTTACSPQHFSPGKRLCPDANCNLRKVHPISLTRFGGN